MSTIFRESTFQVLSVPAATTTAVVEIDQVHLYFDVSKPPVGFDVRVVMQAHETRIIWKQRFEYRGPLAVDRAYALYLAEVLPVIETVKGSFENVSVQDRTDFAFSTSDPAEVR